MRHALPLGLPKSRPLSQKGREHYENAYTRVRVHEAPEEPRFWFKRLDLGGSAVGADGVGELWGIGVAARLSHGNGASNALPCSNCSLGTLACGDAHSNGYPLSIEDSHSWASSHLHSNQDADVHPHLALRPASWSPTCFLSGN